MRSIRKFVLPVMMFAFAVSAQAQATRTWVSGVGDDVNPCSRTAPCKTWAGAISKTAAGGEINALDSGGFGAVTITKSITLDGGGGVHASILNSGTNGININDSLSVTPGTAKVVLRNLAINGAGTTIGTNGIRFLSGKSLTMENVFIHNQSGRGLDVQRPPGASVGIVNIINTTITACGSHAIGLNSTSTTGAVRIAINNSNLIGNGTGLFTGFATEASITDSFISNSTTAGIDANNGSVINADNTTVMNSNIGVRSVSPSAVRLSRNIIIQNASRGFDAGGPIQSYGDNYFAANGVDNGVLTSISTQKK